MPELKDFIDNPDNVPAIPDPTPPTDDKNTPAPDAKPGEPATPPVELGQVVESINQLGETIKGINEKVEELSAKQDDFNKPETAAPAPKEAWEPQSWDDFPKLVEEKAGEIAAKTIEQKEAEKQEAEQNAKNEEDQRTQFVEGQVVELETAGKLPPIKDINDPNDAGRAARRELFGLGAKLGSANLKETQEVLEAQHTAGFKFEFTTDPVAGRFVKVGANNTTKNAPVGNSSNTGGAAGEVKPDYKTIHGARDLATLARKAQGEI